MSRQLAEVNGMTTLTQIVTDSTGLNLLALDSSEPGSIYKSTNGGQSFSVLYTFNDDSVIDHIAADSVLERILISTTTSSSGGANDRSMFVSTNNGVTFNKVTIYNSFVDEWSETISSPMLNGQYRALAVSPDGGIMCSSVTVSNVEKIFFSYDGGSTWYGRETFDTGDIFNGTKRYHSLTCAEGYIYAGTSGGTIHTYSEPFVSYYSTNAPFVNIPTVFTTVDQSETFISMDTDGLFIYALTDDSDPILGNKVFLSNSNGFEFVYYENLPQNPLDANGGSVPLTNYTKIVCYNTTNIIIMNTAGDLILANASGTQVQLIPATSPDVSISDIAINSNGDTLYAVTPEGLYNLPPLPPSLIELVKISTLANINSIVCSSDGTKLYISNSTEIWYSSTSGKTISNYYTIADQNIRFMVGNSDLSYLFVVVEGFGDLCSLNVIYTDISNEPTSAIIYDTEDADISAEISNSIYTAAISSNPRPGEYIYTILDNFTNQHKFYRSSDYGASFRPVTLSFIDSGSRIACSSNGVYVFITSKNATNHMVYVSNDNGSSFISYSNGLPLISVDPYFYLTGISCSSDGQYVFITGRGLTNDSCYKSSNYGQTWISILNVPPITEFHSILSDSTGSHIAIGTVSSLYFSDDAGITWQNTPHPTGQVLSTNPFYITPFTMSSSGLQQYILYLSGQLYQRKETRIVNSDPVTKYATQLICSADASTVLALSALNLSTIYKSVNYGTNFAPLNGITASASGVSKMVASDDCSKILYYTNAGTNSQDGKLYLYNGTSSTEQVVKVTEEMNLSPPIRVKSMAVNFNCSYKYMITLDFNLYISTAMNSDFIESTQLTGNCSYVACNYSGQYVFITTVDGKIAISSDYGQTFILKEIPTYTPDGSNDPESIFGTYITCNSNGSIVYCTTTGTTIGDGIYKATRTGSSWSEVEQIYSVTDGTTIFTDIKCDSTGTYMVAIDDIFFSDDGGATWKMVPNPLPSTVGTVTMNGSGSRIFYTFSGTGMFSRNSSGIATPCFLEGTKILCLVGDEEAYLSVQNLKQGTLVKTLSGFKKVDKIGKSAIQNPAHPGRTMDRLYVCRKENFPELTEDLFITGFHSILVDELTEDQQKKTLEINGRVFEADSKKCLMAAVSEKVEPWAQEGVFTIWHFSLEDEDQETKFGVYSNGLLTETCSMDYIPASSLSQKIEAVSPTPKHFFNKSLVCKKSR